jgi:D-inositol-3-phosphate glycosyltransferase
MNSETTESDATVALFGPGLSQSTPPPTMPVVGMQVVLRDFVAAAAKRTSRFHFRLAQLASHIGAQGGESSAMSRIDVRSVLENPQSVAVWHDLGFDPTRSFAIRRQAGGHYPIVLTHHSLSYKHLVHDCFLPLLLQRPFPCDAITCSSVAARDALAKILEHVAASLSEAYAVDLHYRGRLEVIPLGVDTNHYRPLDQATCRATFDMPAGAFVLLWAGRLSAIDKADLLPLLRVLSSLRAANAERDIILVCAGSEYLEEAYCETLQTFAAAWGLSDALRILRNPQEITPELYGCADVFVSPADSLQESFGLTPVEAMACGIPQVVSDWNGYRDTVVDQITGFRIPTLWAPCASDLIEHWFLHEDAWEHAALGQTVVVDLHALELRLQQLMDNPALRHAMGTASRSRAVALFDWAAVLSKHESLWAELISARPETASQAVFDLQKLPYTEIFGHYATQVLDGREGVSLTTRGKGMQGARVALPKTLAGIVQPDVLSQILDRLFRSNATDDTLTSGELVGELYQDCDLPPSVVLRHLLWLMKHGWVTTSRTSVWEQELQAYRVAGAKK